MTVIDFPGGSDGKVSVYNAGDLGSIPGLGSSLEKEKQPTPELLPRKSHGRRSLVSMGSQRVRHDRVIISRRSVSLSICHTMKIATLYFWSLPTACHILGINTYFFYDFF